MSEGYEVYEAYLDGHEKEINDSKEFVLEVRDLAEFARKVVRAKVAKSVDSLPGGEKLWVRLYKDDQVVGPWAIQITEELDDDQVQPVRADIARGQMPQVDKLY